MFSMANPYASYAAPVVDAAGTKHLIWEDNGRLYHARYDSRAGAWVDKNTVSNAQGGSDIKLLAGNIIPVDQSGKLYAPGLVAAWIQGIGNAAEIYVSVGRYTDDGKLEWSDAVQVSKDAVANTSFDLGIGQDGLIQVVTQKVLKITDPRKSDYQNNPGQLAEDIKSPQQGDKDLYYSTLLIELERKTGSLFLVPNPEVNASGTTDIPDDADVLNFNPDFYVAKTNRTGSLSQILLNAPPSNSPSLQQSGFQSAGLLSASSINPGNSFLSNTDSNSQNDISLPATGGPAWGFDITIGTTQHTTEGTTFPLPVLEEANKFASLFGVELGINLSGAIKTKVSRDSDDVYSVDADLALSVDLVKEQTRWKAFGRNQKLDPRIDDPVNGGLMPDPNNPAYNASIDTNQGFSGIQFSLNFSGSQSSNEKGELQSLENFYGLKVAFPKRVTFNIPSIPGLEGALARLQALIQFSLAIGYQGIGSDPGPNAEAPFTLKPDTKPNLYDGLSGAGGGGAGLFQAITWLTAYNNYKKGTPGLGAGGKIFAGVNTAFSLLAASDILAASGPLIFPGEFDDFNTTQRGLLIEILATGGLSGSILAGLLGAEGTISTGFDFEFLSGPQPFIFKIPYELSIEARAAVLTFSWDISGDIVDTTDSSAQTTSIGLLSGDASHNDQNSEMVRLKLAYSPYQGSTAIHENERFSPVSPTTRIAQPQLLTASQNNYVIGSVSVEEGGSGYLGGESGNFLVVPSIGNALLMAYVEKGVIQQIVVESPGIGYDRNNPPTLDFSQYGGGGSGAKAKVNLIDREVLDLTNDGRPFIDSVVFFAGPSAQAETALIWIADGADSTKPISDSANQLTTRVKVSELAGTNWSIPTALPLQGSEGMNYDPVIAKFISRDNQSSLLAVWAHARADGIGSHSVDDLTNTLDSILETDIYYSVRIGNGTWSNPEKLITLEGTDNRLDIGRLNDGRLHLAWVNAEANATEGGIQRIYSAFFDPTEEAWSTPVAIDPTKDIDTPNRSEISSLKVGQLEGQPAMYWSNTAETPYVVSVLNDSPELYFRLESSAINQSEINYGNLGNSIVSNLSFYDGNMTFGQEGALSQDPDPAVRFNGQGAFVIGIPDKQTVTPTSFSVETWVKLTDTAAGKGIVTRGQPITIPATLPTATLTYKVTQGQDTDGKWFYLITPDSVDLGNSGQDIFPNTLRVTNFRANEQLDIPFNPIESFALRAEPDDFLGLDFIGTDDVYIIRNTPQDVVIGDGTLIVRRFDPGTDKNREERIELSAGQKIQIGGQIYTITAGETFTVSLKAGDNISIFDANPPGTISQSLAPNFNFTPDESGSLSGIQVNSNQILSSGTGFSNRPFVNEAESFTLTAELEFEQIEDWYLVTGDNGSIVFNSGAGEISSESLDQGQWHHVVATHNSTTKESILYINGQEVAKTIGERFAPSDNPILVGYNLNGFLDEVAIYNKPLTVADPNAVEFDSTGKYVVAFNPNAPAGEITSHFNARDVDPDSAEEATYYSVWNGERWGTPEQFTAEYKLTPTQASLSRTPAVDMVGSNGLQPDGVLDQHLQVTLALPNEFLFGRTITGIEIKDAQGNTWSINNNIESPLGSNLVGAMLAGQRVNDLKNGAFEHTVMGVKEVLDLYFDDPNVQPDKTYSVTFTMKDGGTIPPLDNLAPSPNIQGSSSKSSIVKAEILEKEVTSLAEVDSGVIIDIDSVGAGQSLAAGKIRNGEIGFAIGHPYQIDEDLNKRGLVWVLPAGTNKKLNELTGIPLKNDDVPAEGALIIGKNGDKIGYAMAVGDIDGDGIDDLIIGAPDADDKKGKIYVISGKYLGSGHTINLASLPDNAVVTIEGTRLSNAGFSLAAGDVNGNQFDDIVIGAPNALNSEGKAVGAVHLIYGSADFFSGNKTIVLGTNNLLFEGKRGTAKSKFELFPNPANQWHSQVGYSVAIVRPGATGNPNAHSFNADLVADILIGAPGYHQTVQFDRQGFPKGISAEQLSRYRSVLNHVPNFGTDSVAPERDLNTGRVYLIFGGDNLTVNGPLNDENLSGKGVIFDGSPLEDGDMRLGEVVTSAGDMNGDGYVDIAMSAPEAAGRSGLVFIFGGRGGSDSIRLKDKYSVMTESDVLIAGGDVFNYAGQSLAGVGDVNNDKIDDLLVGVPQAGGAKGQNYVIFGVENFEIGKGNFPTTISLKQGIPDDSFVFNGGIAQGLAGYAVAKGFDLNGDTVGDMLLSAPFANQVYVGFGHPWLKKEGSVRLDNLANDNGIIINRYEGSEPKYSFDGRRVTNLGDINGDGYADTGVAGNGDSILIQFGGPTWDLIDAGFGVGQLSVFLRKDVIKDINFESIDGVGDINNDGFDDFIIYNSRSKTQEVYDFTIVYGGDYLNSLGSATIDVAVAPGEEVRQRQPLTPRGFALGQLNNTEIYKQSLRLGESIYAPVLVLSEHRNFDFDQDKDIPIQPHLKLEQNGELKYYDEKGNVIWTSGKADAGIVKMEIALLDGKQRLVFKDKNNAVVTYSSEYLDYAENQVPYLRVGYDFVTLSQRHNDNIRRTHDSSLPYWLSNQRQEKVLYSAKDQFDYADYIYNSTSTVWGNVLPSLIGGEHFTTPDGDKSFGVMPVSSYSEGFPHGPEPSIIGILERIAFTSVETISRTKSIWSPAPTGISFGSPTDVYLRFRDNGELVVDFNNDSGKIWSSNTVAEGLFLNLNLFLSRVDIAQDAVEIGESQGAIGYQNLYGSSFGDNLPQFFPVGDLNSDGYKDLMTFDSNKIYIYFGSVSNSDDITANFNNFTKFEYESPGFGLTGGVGDINGDGKDDLFTLSREGTFISYDVGTNSPITNKAVTIFDFSTNVDYFDNVPSIFAVGDVNGDGFADFIVRNSHVVAGSTRGALRLVYGNATGDNFQSTQIQTYLPVYYSLPVTGAGDANGDGYDDIIFSDPSYLDNNAGRVYILFGGSHLTNKATITPEEINSLEGKDGFVIDGLASSDSYSRAGESVSGGGDMNGDGFKDFIIGAPGTDGTVGLTYGLFGGDFTKSVNQAGTLANDILEGTGTGDVIIGLAGDDTLMGNGGRDVLYGGAGDNTIIIADTYFQRIDGGSGFNNLKLQGYRGQDWDLTALSPGLRLQNISAIDMTNYGSNTLTLNKTTVMKMTGTQNNLLILGDANDEIILDAEFRKVDSFNLFGTLFDRYQAGTANVLVAPNIKTEVKFTANRINQTIGLSNATPVTNSRLLSAASPNSITTIIPASNGQPTQFFVVANPTREDAGVFTFTVNRSGDLSKSVTALYQTVNDTAIAGRDYTAILGTLVFAPGEISKVIEVPLLDNDEYGGNNRSFGLAIQAIDDIFGERYGSNFLQLGTDSGNQIRNLDSGSLAPETVKQLGVALPFGAMSFSVTAPEGSAIVTMPFQGITELNSYFRFNQISGQYEEFLYDGESGVEFLDTTNDGRADTLKIHLLDQGRGDGDGLGNGVITGLNVPAIVNPGLVQVNPGVFLAPTNGDGVLQLRLITNQQESNQIGWVMVDDANGSIDGLLPDAPGYLEAALVRKQVVFENAYSASGQAFDRASAQQSFTELNALIQTESQFFGSLQSLELGGGEYYIFYNESSSQTVFSVNTPVTVETESRGYHQISFDGLTMEIASKALVVPGNLDDLVVGQISIGRAGAYENQILLYQVDSLTGGIDTDGDRQINLRPGDVGYVEAALKRAQNPATGVSFNAPEGFFSTGQETVNLRGGSMYGMAIIPNATIGEVLSLNPNNNPELGPVALFSFDGANPAGISQMSRLGSNLFGFEDMVGGGDADYNDVILQFAYQI